jgi:PD-(D/E)XK nuclease superfamily protein
MWRKANRLAGAQLKHCKERGEWAELYFMMMAAGFGMKVSKPFGDLGRYDVGVESHIRQSHARENKAYENEGRVLRVQVKSTIYKRLGDRYRLKDRYSLNMMGFHRKRYLPGTVDFFAVLLIPVDDWYIIPYEVMGSKKCTLHFTPSRTK